MKPSRKKRTKNGGVFDNSDIKNQIAQLEAQTAQDGFWNDKENANKLFGKLSDLKNSYEPWKELVAKVDETQELGEVVFRDYRVGFAEELLDL